MERNSDHTLWLTRVPCGRICWIILHQQEFTFQFKCKYFILWLKVLFLAWDLIYHLQQKSIVLKGIWILRLRTARWTSSSYILCSTDRYWNTTNPSWDVHWQRIGAEDIPLTGPRAAKMVMIYTLSTWWLSGRYIDYSMIPDILTDERSYHTEPDGSYWCFRKMETFEQQERK